MANEEWGVKRLCPTTGKRFYDLNKTPIVSPYTGEVVELDNNKRSMIAADAEDGVTKKAREADTADTSEDLLDGDDVDLDVEDDLLEEEDDDNVSLDDLADVAADDDD